MATDSPTAAGSGLEPSDGVRERGTQLEGWLEKMATSLKARWAKRWFVLKDGWLLYYTACPSSPRVFDVHPKGVFPLYGAMVDIVRNARYGVDREVVVVSNSAFGGRELILSTEDTRALNKWQAAIAHSRFVSYPNAIAGARALEVRDARAAELEAQLQGANAELAEAKAAAAADRDTALAERQRCADMQRMFQSVMLENSRLKILANGKNAETGDDSTPLRAPALAAVKATRSRSRSYVAPTKPGPKPAPPGHRDRAVAAPAPDAAEPPTSPVTVTVDASEGHHVVAHPSPVSTSRAPPPPPPAPLPPARRPLTSAIVSTDPGRGRSRRASSSGSSIKDLSPVRSPEQQGKVKTVKELRQQFEH